MVGICRLPKVLPGNEPGDKIEKLLDGFLMGRFCVVSHLC